MEFSFETVFDPRCGFVLVEAMDRRAGNQCRATEHNIIRVATDSEVLERFSGVIQSDSFTLSAWIGYFMNVVAFNPMECPALNRILTHIITPVSLDRGLDCLWQDTTLPTLERPTIASRDDYSNV